MAEEVEVIPINLLIPMFGVMSIFDYETAFAGQLLLVELVKLCDRRAIDSDKICSITVLKDSTLDDWKIEFYRADQSNCVSLCFESL